MGKMGSVMWLYHVGIASVAVVCWLRVKGRAVVWMKLLDATIFV